MEQAQVLKARLASLSELRGLFQALRALAATRLQEAQGALAGIRAYAAIIAEGLADAHALADDGEPPAGRGSALIVVCSEHGFAGGFNARLLDQVPLRRKPGQALIVLGQRGVVMAGERHLPVDRSLPMATHVAGVAASVHELAAALAPFAEAEVIFGSYTGGGGFVPAHRRILPPELPPEVAKAATSARRRAPPLHQLPPEVLIAQLDREYLFAELSKALMESFASENGARLRVMEAADHAIADKLEVLHRAENDLRQEAITSELLDVVTGSEAILASGG